MLFHGVEQRVRPLIGLFLALGVLAPHAVRGQVVATELTGTAATLTLTWPQAATVAAEQTGAELVLRFNQKVSYEAFAATYPRLGKWLAAADFGYDSVVLTLQPGAAAVAELQNGSIVLRLTQAAVEAVAPEGPTPPLHADEGGLKRLQLLKAALAWATGEVWEAAELLEVLAAQDPTNSDVLGAKSVVEARLGRWRHATLYNDRAQALVGTADRSGLPLRGSEHAPRVVAQWRADDLPGVAMRMGVRAQGHGFVADGLRLTAAYERADVTAAAGGLLAPAAVGTAPQPQSLTDHLADVGLRYDAPSGSWWHVRGLATPAGAGVAGHGELWDRYGTTWLSASANEPLWDLASLVALQATRSSVGIGRRVGAWAELGRALGGDLTAQFSAHLERWHAARDPGGQTDLIATASAQFATQTEHPRMLVSYAVSHLQVLSDPIAAGKGGSKLASVLARHHLHVATVGLQWPLWQWLAVSGFGGYGLSVYSANSAQFGGAVGWQPPTGFQALIQVQRGVSTDAYGVAASTLRATAGMAF